jgi:hypothetical protein
MNSNTRNYSYKVTSELQFHDKRVINIPVLREKIPIEEFTNVFVKKGYLNEEYANLMNDFHLRSKEYEKIIWEKDLKSLLTFIFLVDLFDNLQIPLTGKRREHFYSFKKNGTKEKKELLEQCQYLPLVRDNFLIRSPEKIIKMYDRSTICRTWNQITNAFNEILNQYLDKIKTKMTKEKPFYFKALLFYLGDDITFGDKKSNNPEKERISREMIEIFCKITSKIIEPL